MLGPPTTIILLRLLRRPHWLSSLASFLVSGFCPRRLSFKSQNDPLETSGRTNHACAQNLLKALHHLSWMKNKALRLTYKALEDLSSTPLHWPPHLSWSPGSLSSGHTAITGAGTGHLLFSASQNVHLLVALSRFSTAFQYFLKYCLWGGLPWLFYQLLQRFQTWFPVPFAALFSPLNAYYHLQYYMFFLVVYTS